MILWRVFSVGIENFWLYTEVNSVALQRNQNCENFLKIVTSEDTVRFFLLTHRAVLSVPHGICCIFFFVGIENFLSYTEVNSVALQQNQNFKNRLKFAISGEK